MVVAAAIANRPIDRGAESVEFFIGEEARHDYKPVAPKPLDLLRADNLADAQSRPAAGVFYYARLSNVDCGPLPVPVRGELRIGMSWRFRRWPRFTAPR